MFNINILKVLITITTTFYGGIVSYASSNEVNFCSDKTPPDKPIKTVKLTPLLRFALL